MKLIVNKDRSVIPIGTWGTKNENNYEILDFEFPEELDGYNKRIVYYLDNKRVWDAIVYNKAYITNAITKYEKVNAYVWLTKNEIITLKYVCDGTEEGNYYFTYDNANYYFTMPEVEENDELIFDVATSTLKLDNTTIATTSIGAGTELTFETIIDAEEDFRTQLFEMQFYENENADGIVPTPEQVDGFNTMLTAMNNKITEIDALETTIEGAEAQRQEAEATRVSNESTRESNESTRQTNEQTRQTQEADRERRTDEAIADIEDKTAEYNANAEAKTTAFNNNATQKTNDFNSNYTQKVNDFNSNATSKTNDFNSNASGKTTTFNDNATSKTNTFNSNASSKTTDFNTNAENKTSAFNTNASDKTTAFDNNASSRTSDFNTNAESKTNTFNDNATQKTTDFNNNAQAKTDAFDEHTEEMQQEIDELSANMPWNTTEQATEISVDDAAKYSKNHMKVFGNTEQNSYQGYNLVDVSPYQEETKNGVTLAKDSEGNIILNGTSTSAFGWNVSLPETRVLPAGTYTKSITKDSNVGNYLTVSIGYNGASISGTSIQPSRGINSMPLEQDTSFDQIRMYIANGTTFNNYKLSYMILSGEYTAETIPDYEPYTNGPSPNPDYPQDIHVVTGNNSIECNSKNLYNATTQYTSRGIRVECDTQFIYLDGKATSTGSINFPTIPLKKGTYKIMLELVSGSITSTSESTLFYVYGTTSTSVIRLSDNQKKNSRTFVLNTNGNMYIHLWARTTETFTNAKIAYQVVKGSTDDYNFVPYRLVTYPLELCIGKNRFNISESKLGKSMDTSGSVTNSIYTNLSNYISVKANKTYTLSFKYETLMRTNDRTICYYDKNKVFISGNNYVVANKLFTFTPAQDGYIRFTYDKNCYDIQVEEGDTATEYVSYTSLELCKIGNYQDYFYKENGNWYKYEAIDKIVLDGTESWNMPNSSSYPHLFQVNDVDLDFVSQDNNAISNYFIWRTSLAEIDGFKLFVSSNRKYLRINHLEITSTADFKTWLSTHNTNIYYQVATPTSTQITDETLISQLEAIYNHLQLVKGTNNISITASDLAPYVTLNYMQDLPSKLDNLDSRLSLLE